MKEVQGLIVYNSDYRNHLIKDFSNKLLAIKDEWKPGLGMYDVFKEHYSFEIEAQSESKLITDLRDEICNYIGRDISCLFGGGEFPFFQTYIEGNILYYNITR